ncbi:kexin KEX2 ASCRUDRAFT_80883 [Ascoidea rubescens DSM 1968]|uniref:P/Homo B domain-containing protein n=1 Tax=Ascoidea rubescens DSM 1968 TaxID=1344418 RepID=A0A1D2VHN3_9ASCO|nr:hypothetical protein ASCRUDRAFT_80883 [Ascoidea rubescens DSM 1968]ODV61135.1 hypothetical protein ASCRUDRAFT_80883 [Ascoidea rubescens DSM 1968]
MQNKEKKNINDPEFPNQWHLFNKYYPQRDLNVTGLWYENITGSGIVTAIIDDGIDYNSIDLKNSYCKEGSWDFNSNSDSPLPKLYNDYHGTRCAGEIAASKNDGFCGVGIAYDSKVSGIRILSGEITNEDEAVALIYRLDINDIYSCSWGPNDNGQLLEGPDKLVKEALIKGVTEGRNNKGAIYVWASGNGGKNGDNCNYDGYTNSIYSITVGAIDYTDYHSSYSEACSAVLISTYSSGFGKNIYTTDINGKCTNKHSGTSAAAPLAAGVYALLLSYKPQLTWRDVQYLTILSSVEVDIKDKSWKKSFIYNKRYSHVYGYGKIDSYKLIELSKNWKNVKPQSWYYLQVYDINEGINENDDIDNIKSRFQSQKDTIVKKNFKLFVDEKELRLNNFERIEHVNLIINLDASIRGKVEINLISPNGIKSELGVQRPHDKSNEGFRNWSFMSVAHWNESGHGEWIVEVVNYDNENNNVFLKNIQLKLFGESIHSNKAQNFGEFSMNVVLIMSLISLGGFSVLGMFYCLFGFKYEIATESEFALLENKDSESEEEEEEEAISKDTVEAPRNGIGMLQEESPKNVSSSGN